MIIGRLRHKINIEAHTTTQNSYGEPVNTWTTFINSIWASIDPLNAKEFFSSDKINADITHKVRIRYRTGILPKMRVKHENRYFEIVGPAINFEEKNKELLLMCREVVV